MPRPSAERLARFRRSPAWGGEGFKNRLPSPMLTGKRMSVLGRFLFQRNDREPPAPLPSLPVDPGALVTGTPGLHLTWLGHSTVWIELGGRTVLLDPVWAERASPVQWGGPRRFQPVPLALEALPLPDVVLVSHDHYDHLDKATVVALAARGARIVTALGVGARLEAWGIAAAQVTELDWGEDHEPVPGLRIHALPARHFSGRSVGDRNETLWASWALVGGGQRVYFGGDGGMDEEAFADIGRRFGPFDVTLLEIGAFDPAWASIHLGPENAVKANALLDGKLLLPVHWGTFNLGLHPWDSPAEELLEAAAGNGSRIVLPRLGERFAALAPPSIEPWWRVLRAPAREAAEGFAVEPAEEPVLEVARPGR